MSQGLADWAPLPLRYAVGAVFFVHGAGIVFGDLAEWSQRFQTLGVPKPELVSVAFGVVQFAGGICIILGIFTRFFALIMAFLAALAIANFKWHVGFAAERDSALGLQGVGYEFEITLIAANLALMMTGGGLLSIDRLIGGQQDDD